MNGDRLPPELRINFQVASWLSILEGLHRFGSVPHPQAKVNFSPPPPHDLLREESTGSNTRTRGVSVGVGVGVGVGVSASTSPRRTASDGC